MASIRLSPRPLLLSSVVRALYHTTVAVLLFLTWTLKWFQVKNDGSTAIPANYIKASNSTAAMFVRIYILMHLISAVVNVANAILAKRFVNSLYKAFFYYAFVMLM